MVLVLVLTENIYLRVVFKSGVVAFTLLIFGITVFAYRYEQCSIIVDNWKRSNNLDDLTIVVCYTRLKIRIVI